jgi:hypothetical protein
MVKYMGKDWQESGPIDVAYTVRIYLGWLSNTMKKLGLCPVSWPGTSKIQFLECYIHRFVSCSAHNIWVWRKHLRPLESLELSLKYSFPFFILKPLSFPDFHLQDTHNCSFCSICMWRRCRLRLRVNFCLCSSIAKFWQFILLFYYISLWREQYL